LHIQNFSKKIDFRFSGAGERKPEKQHKMSRIGGIQNPRRSEDSYSETHRVGRSQPHHLDEIREEESYDEYMQNYPALNLETSSTRYQIRGFNQYLVNQDQITERSHEYLSTLDSHTEERSSVRNDPESLIRSYRTEDMKQGSALTNFERLSKQEDILVSDLGAEKSKYIDFERGSVDTIAGKSKTIQTDMSEHQDMFKSVNTRNKSLEQEKLVLYVNRGRSKSKTKNSKKTNENSQKSEDHPSKYSQKDSSTERKTREISTSEMKRKRENLTL